MKKKLIILFIFCIPFFLFPNLLFSKTINEDIFLRFPWNWNVNKVKVYNTSAYVFSSGKEVTMSLFNFKKEGAIELSDFINIISQSGLFKEIDKKTFGGVETRILGVNKTINNQLVNSFIYIMQGTERLYIFSFEPEYEMAVNEILISIKIKK